MKILAHIVVAAALAGGIAAPASAQVEANAHAQGVIGDIIDGLIGNRYAVSDRQAIRRCGGRRYDKAERQFRTQFRGPARLRLSRLSRLCPRRRDHRCPRAACSTACGSAACSTRRATDRRPPRRRLRLPLRRRSQRARERRAGRAEPRLPSALGPKSRPWQALDPRDLGLERLPSLTSCLTSSSTCRR